MAELQTCCPHCSTTFLITDAQLQMANGVVRCGSCLQIFTALDHLVETQDPSTPTHEPSPNDCSEDEHTNTASEGPSNIFSFDQQNDVDGYSEDAILTDDLDDDVLISDDMHSPVSDDGFGELSDEFLSGHQVASGNNALFERKVTTQNITDIEDCDESWAEQMLHELDDDDGLNSNLTSENTPLSSTTTVPSEIHDYNMDDVAEFDLESSTLAPKNDSPNHNTTSPLDIAETHTEITCDEHTTEHNDDFFADEAEDNLEYDDLTTHQDDDDAKDNELRDSVSALLGGIGATPVEMQAPDEQSKWPQRLLWLSLCVVASTVMVAQVGWFKFSDLSRQQPYRTWYAQVCPLIGCQLPSVNAPHLIKAYNLVVRSHPQQKSALMIDSILLNTAAFEQSFPDLILSFSDINNNVVAQRRFSPLEYLGGELAGITTIPSEQPIHIALEIVDPGDAAINYSMDIAM